MHPHAPNISELGVPVFVWSTKLPLVVPCSVQCVSCIVSLSYNKVNGKFKVSLKLRST